MNSDIEEDIIEEDIIEEKPASPDPDIIAITHSVVFKCIGVTKDAMAQQTLERAYDLISQVPVELKPEPHNPKDSKAIAFMCRLDEKPYRIGYVVREALSDVHEAIASNSIVSVEFAWVKYLTTWTISGPGWFAGIKITRNGSWSNVVVRSGSTKH